jgi:hypothetical protein
VETIALQIQNEQGLRLLHPEADTTSEYFRSVQAN